MVHVLFLLIGLWGASEVLGDEVLWVASHDDDDEGGRFEDRSVHPPNTDFQFAGMVPRKR